MQAILIGLGSIGKRHLQQLEKRCQRVVIIDPYASEPTQIGSGAQFFRSLESYKEISAPELSAKRIPDVAVIANWGPNHFGTVLELRELGISKFLIEKPLASRYSELEKLESMAASQDIQVWSNFHLRHDETTDFLREFIAKKGLGSPCLMTVSGGAKCLATTGIHWIDYFLLFSEELAFEIQSRIQVDRINPRSQDLSFLEGFINLSTDTHALNLNFTNRSYADASVELFWNAFKVQISEGKFRLLESQNPDIALLPITRTQPFNKLIYESDFGLTGLENLYDAFFNSKESMDRVFLANKLLLQSLIHSDSRMQLPKEGSENLRDKDYLIS
jgi:hypothetical protein